MAQVMPAEVRQPAGHLLNVLGLEAVRVHVPETQLVELIGDQVENPLAIGLRGEAAVVIAMTQLLEGIIQIPHKRSSFEWRIAIAVAWPYAGVGQSGKCFCSPSRP